MIHLLVGSYVQKPDSGVFSDWSTNNTYGLLSSDYLSYFNETSVQKLVRKWNVADKGSFFQDKFSFALVEAPAECCSGDDVLAVLLVGFLNTTDLFSQRVS